MDYILASVLFAIWLVASVLSILLSKGVASWGDFLKLSLLGGFFGGLSFGLLGFLLSGVVLLSFWPGLNMVFAVNAMVCLGCFLGTLVMSYGSRREWAKEK